MSFRKILFWAHLIAGCVAGAVVLTMSVTGVLLTYERRILAKADRGKYRTASPPAGAQRLSVDELLTRIESSQGALPRGASVVMRSDAGEPVEISLGREGSIFANPYDGRVLGGGDAGMHAFFQEVTAWHRWFAVKGEGRNTAKAITGASNLAFLFLVASGLWLWLPKVWSRQHLRPIVWFKGGLSGKARDFNWHNVFGLWAAIPLLIVVACAVPMSYTWATNLIYQVTGSEMPARPGERGPARDGGRGKSAAERPALQPLWARAEQQVPGWRSISLRLPERPGAEVAFLIDTGDGGQPQNRATLTLDPATGQVKKWETFSDFNSGRQWRTWSRFAHTGEYYGLAGQTLAGIGSVAGVMLVWTGIALALRRFAAWRTRRASRSRTVVESHS